MHDYFQYWKTSPILRVEDYSTVLISFTIWIQTHGKINSVQNIMLCINQELEKSFPFYQVGKSILANLAGLEYRDLLPDTIFLLSVCCPLKITLIAKKISGANLMDGSMSLWLELAKMSPFWICRNMWLTNANITLDSLLEW